MAVCNMHGNSTGRESSPISSLTCVGRQRQQERWRVQPLQRPLAVPVTKQGGDWRSMLTVSPPSFSRRPNAPGAFLGRPLRHPFLRQGSRGPGQAAFAGKPQPLQRQLPAALVPKRRLPTWLPIGPPSWAGVPPWRSGLPCLGTRFRGRHICGPRAAQAVLLAHTMEHLEVRLATFRSELSASIAEVESQQDGLRGEFDDLRRRVGQEVKAEATALLNRERSAIRQLDEQLWRVDERLGRRIDALAESSASPADERAAAVDLAADLVLRSPPPRQLFAFAREKQVCAGGRDSLTRAASSSVLQPGRPG